MQARILVVDDDALIREFFVTILTKRGYGVKTAEDGQAAVELLDAEQFDLVISDVYMPRMDGLALLRHVLGRYPLIPVVMLTAFATVENAVEAMKTGAFDYIAKPVTDLPRFDVTISRAIQHRSLLVENQQLRSVLASGSTYEQIIGPGAKMQKVFKLISSVASSTANVLVTGPSGSGKELVARAIHTKSPRANGPFISINCAAVPEGLIESELFGHQKGAFTTAYQSKKGKFEQADNGTLLLDEIGDMPHNLQAKLLRVIETREFERVGGTEPIKVDVRIVATTNVNLEKAVQEGKFRQDLFFRLNVFPIKMPALIERREDITVLAHHFMRRHSKLHGKSVEQINPEALRYLVNAPWQGNVRELSNVVERAVLMSRSSSIDLSDFFEDDVPDNWTNGPEIPANTQIIAAEFEAITLAELEKRHILATLKSLDGQRLKTAEQLDISIRTLRNKLNQYRAEGEKLDGPDEIE